MDLTSAAEEGKSDESGGVGAASPHPSLTASPQPSLTPGVAEEMMSYLTPDQLRSIVAASIIDPPAVLDRVRSVADEEPAHRRLLIRGLGYETTADTLRSIFSAYGEVTDVVVIYNEATGKSKRFGFITFKHLDGALLANSEPTKQIDGHFPFTELVRLPRPVAPLVRAAPVTAARNVYIGNIPPDLSTDRLLAVFSSYGEIEKGPLGFERRTGKLNGKPNGHALFWYKSVDAARALGSDTPLIIDGHQLVCRFIIEQKLGMIEDKPSGGPYSLSSSGHSGQHHQTGGSPPGHGIPPGGVIYQGMPPYS